MTPKAFERTHGSVVGVRLTPCFASARWRAAQRDPFGKSNDLTSKLLECRIRRGFRKVPV
jgi:hypothetical protein